MVLDKQHRKILKLIESNPKIQTRELIELTGIGKPTFYKHIRYLEKEGYVSHEKFRREYEWYLIRKTKKEGNHGFLTHEQSTQQLEEEYNNIESKVFESLKKVSEKSTMEKYKVYSDVMSLVLGKISVMKLILIYRGKKIPKNYEEFVSRLERLFQRIFDENLIPDHGFTSVFLNDIVRQANDSLDEYLGIKKEAIEYV